MSTNATPNEETLALIKKISDHVPGVIYQFQLFPNGRSCFPFASAGIECMYRVTPEEIREDATKVFDILHPDDLASVNKAIEKSAQDLTVWNHEYRVKFDDGTVRWLLGHASPQLEPDGSVLWHGFMTDITERKRADEKLKRSTKELKESQRIANIGSWHLDKETNEVIWTEELYRMYGFDPSLPPPPYTEHMKLFTPESWKRLSSALANTIENGTPYTLELETLKNDGANGWMWVHGEVEVDSSGKMVGLWGVAQDITERKNKERALEESIKRFQDIAEISADWIWEVDTTGTYTYVSKGAYTLLGYSQEEIIGKKYYDLMTDIEAQRVKEIFTLIAQRNEPFFDLENNVIDSKGKEHTTLTSGAPIFDALGICIGYRGVDRDITERKLLEEQVNEIAFHDPLTHLANRYLLNDRLHQNMAVSKRTGLYGAVIFLDLDNFKPLNDTHGHNVGDLLLIEVANRLLKCVRAMDTVARFGGDEFVVILSELDTDMQESTRQAQAVAEKIHAFLAEPYILHTGNDMKSDVIVEHLCSASIGVTLFINHDFTQEEVIQQADIAMYQAKESGRNRVNFYHSI